MLVWRRRHASLSFQRAVTPTKLTRTKHTGTRKPNTPPSRHSLAARLEISLETSLGAVHPRVCVRRHQPSVAPILLRVSRPHSPHTHTHTHAHICTHAPLWTPARTCAPCNEAAYARAHTFARRYIRRAHGCAQPPAPFRVPAASRSTAQFPLTLIYLNYILRASACVRVRARGRVRARVRTRTHTLRSNVRASRSRCAEFSSRSELARNDRMVKVRSQREILAHLRG
jgi:hypothetical protein